MKSKGEKTVLTSADYRQWIGELKTRYRATQIKPALDNYAKQYPMLPITIKGYKRSHDRFLIVDNVVWHIGASLKDAGSALFALMKMELAPSVILGLLP